MTRDDIIRMAREAGLADGIELDREIAEFERFANLVAAAEREACWQIVHDTYEGFGVGARGVEFIKNRIMQQIKERGNHG